MDVACTKAHRVALDPTNKQATLLAKTAGVSRFAYNWALATWHDMYELTKVDPAAPKPNQLALRRHLNAVKTLEYPWMKEVTKCAPQEAIINLGRAFDGFFAGRSQYPTFKSRGAHDSFKVSRGAFRVEGNRIRLPRIGWVKMHEAFRWPDATPISATVSRSAERWFVAISAEVFLLHQPVPEGVVGVDVGVREYVTSDGVRYTTPQSYRRAQQRLRRAQQSLARKTKGSKNRERARLRVATLHVRSANIRSDWLHKVTTELSSSYSTICIEDLNVKGMVRNHHLAKSISDASFAEFRRQLLYKSTERNTTVVIANRWYPSSKLCSGCGVKTKHLSLATRMWTCSECNTTHDRDRNAAINLRNYAASSAVSACGEFFASGSSSLEYEPSNLDEAGIRHQMRLEHV